MEWPGNVLCILPMLQKISAILYGGDSIMRELRCQCISTVSTPFHKKHIRSLEVTPNGPHCPRVEVIVTLRNGVQHCLNPKAKWLTTVVKKILKRNSQKK
ncbi:hypothetical protein XENTR_v10001012 [Xenopus tropicalis]|uniref:C-X-C motif chemokine n=1 Tax=Xenopus tropicalis TaxID=8364 RepID=A0A803JT64_XENTR|nr:hypothetical protein XENTR_v10001012 [Xenopus tropicalis]